MTKRRLQRVLLVDDDEDIRRVGVLGLRRVGRLEVEECASGPEALRRTPEFEPDVILLDMMMPGMDGLEVFEALASTPDGADVPVIFVTARAQMPDIARYLMRGAIGVIKKPFDPMTLADEVRLLWANWLDEEDDGDGRDSRAIAPTDELAIAYRLKLRTQQRIIEALLDRLGGENEQEALEEMRAIVHKFAGSGAIFGFPVVSEVCAEFERRVVEILDDPARPDDEDLGALRMLCARLRRELHEGEDFFGGQTSY